MTEEEMKPVLAVEGAAANAAFEAYVEQVLAALLSYGGS
jgi:hypothetical protein